MAVENENAPVLLNALLTVPGLVGEVLEATNSRVKAVDGLVKGQVVFSNSLVVDSDDHARVGNR